MPMKSIIKIFLAVFLGTAIILPSQGKTRYYKKWSLFTSLDTVLLKVSYLKTYKECEGDTAMGRSIYTLKIGEDISHFFGSTPDYFFDHAPADIIERDEKESGKGIRWSYSIREWKSNYSDERVNMQYWKNYPEKGMLGARSSLIVGGGKGFFGYYEPIPVFDWQLEDGDSIVCGYPCNKATASLRGRTWHVWYTLDIPYSDGLWKLCGLPGLILKATDSTGEFDFTAIAIEVENSKFEEKNKITISNYSTINKIPPLQMEQMTKLYYDDIIAYYLKKDGAKLAEQLVARREELGNPLKPEHKKPCLIEYYGEKK